MSQVTDNEEDPPPRLPFAESLGESEAERLKGLATEVKDQDELERDFGSQADRLLIEQADERDQKRFTKTREHEDRLQNQVRKLQEQLKHPAGPATNARRRAELEHLQASIRSLNTDLEQIENRIKRRQEDEGHGETGTWRAPGESQRDFLIRTGKITPFSKMQGGSLGRSDSTLQEVLLGAEEDEPGADSAADDPIANEAVSHRHLVQPGFRDDQDSDASLVNAEESSRPRKRRRLHREYQESKTKCEKTTSVTADEAVSEQLSEEEGDTYLQDTNDRDVVAGDDSMDITSEEVEDDLLGAAAKSQPGGRRTRETFPEDHAEDLTSLDDGDERLYKKRLQRWITRRSAARNKANSYQNKSPVSTDGVLPKTDLQSGDTHEDQNLDENIAVDEWYLPHPNVSDAFFEGGYKLPGDIFPSLFNYQQTGVQWLWELYSQQVGGIVGDEMGLGKTIQIIAFLAGLHYSKKITKPILVVAPATVMKQWVNEFHTWWPPFRVSILHSSGSGMINVGRESRYEDELMSTLPNSANPKPVTKDQKSARRIVERVAKEGHVLVTTYSGLQSYANLLIPTDWEYAVLDEGHKIRNPNTAVTIYCKELRTANRVILSGTPMQNNLVELWSLFDYVFPMRLGTLVNFRQQFEFPIRQGGYANATNLQVQTAMKCAETLKDTISPYLLQRFKADVASDLPKKSEQVVYCPLTKLQRDAYKAFLGSDDLKAIMSGKRQVLYGIDILRKICNHPDLQNHKVLAPKTDYDYGSGSKSGKLKVVKNLLELWKEQGHKTLLFAQHRIMLDILEKFIRSMRGLKYHRMDGATAISARQSLVDDFNNNPALHVFLLTTKVGGLGINLTGADRVIIYDPDWNPSTDVQARERAWRLGQKREVKIYRLMTPGTIEEKIFNRQMFKQVLINKVLKDPKNIQKFENKDLYDLFTLGGPNDPATETTKLFGGTEERFDQEDACIAPVMTNGNAVKDISLNNDNDADDISNVAGISSVQPFYTKEEQKVVDTDATNSEARVMAGIFARSGVQAVLEHGQIVNGKKIITADPRIIEQEAKKVAAAAAEELKKAGEAAKNIPVGTPTWTGQFGSAGRPEHQQRRYGLGRGGPASSSVLAGLQASQAADEVASVSRVSTSGSSVLGPKGVDFMKMIRNYLTTHGGQVHTQMLIDHFNRYCNTPVKTAEFKAMLTEIARLEKGTRGRGRWVLKEDYI